jgi:hypothetical protein
MYVGGIQPTNQALTFIDRRLKDDAYRGSASSEHNRYDMQEIFTILSLMDEYVPNFGKMRIRDTDMSKRPINTADEAIYADFAESVKRKVGKGTQDSIRKNIFVDVHRMGLINRFNEQGKSLDAYERGAVKFVSLSHEGDKFIKSSLLDRAFLFTKALDRLLGGYVEISLDLLKDQERTLERITKYEFMFFVSAIDTETSFNVSMSQSVDLIKSWRLLGRTQQKAVIETLKQRLQPKLFKGTKTDERDWHNWQNKIDQVYHLFKQTPYFDVSGPDKEILTLSTRKVQTKSGEILDLPKRSIAEKFEYFKSHKVEKTAGYELHHVLPLSWSESAEQYKMFDKWQNMVYIDAFSHAKITQNRNRNIHMLADGENLILSDFVGNQVPLVRGNTILYSMANQPLMLNYNAELRTTIK